MFQTSRLIRNRQILGNFKDDFQSATSKDSPRLNDSNLKPTSARTAANQIAKAGSLHKFEQASAINLIIPNAFTIMQTDTLEDEGIKQIEETVTDIDGLFKERIVLECF